MGRCCVPEDGTTSVVSGSWLVVRKSASEPGYAGSGVWTLWVRVRVSRSAGSGVWTLELAMRVSRSGTGRLAGGAIPNRANALATVSTPGPRSENDRAATAGTRSRVSTKGRLRILVPAVAARSWVRRGPGVRILRARWSCSGPAPPANLPVPLRDTFASRRPTDSEASVTAPRIVLRPAAAPCDAEGNGRVTSKLQSQRTLAHGRRPWPRVGLVG